MWNETEKEVDRMKEEIGQAVLHVVGFAVGVVAAAADAASNAIARVASAYIGASAEVATWLTGGRCKTVSGLRACKGGWLRLYGRKGTQWGDTFVSGRDPEDLEPGLIAHEKHHRDEQWRRYGALFGPMYIGAEVKDVWIDGKECNRWEQAAEDASRGGGGYPC